MHLVFIALVHLLAVAVSMLLVQTKVYSTPEVMPKICQVTQVYAKMLKYYIEKGKELRGRSFS